MPLRLMGYFSQIFKVFLKPIESSLRNRCFVKQSFIWTVLLFLLLIFDNTRLVSFELIKEIKWVLLEQEELILGLLDLLLLILLIRSSVLLERLHLAFT